MALLARFADCSYNFWTLWLRLFFSKQKNMTPIDHITSKILDNRNLLQTISKWKSQKETIVFTNGCFDILHRGHIDYLAKAKALGNRLIIGVNSDFSVNRLKGNCRPIQDEQSRLLLLAALEFTDGVTLFSEQTPFHLIEQIMPHILVKGADYEVSQIVGADIVIANGGKVITIPYLEGFSSTNIIAKILKD
jgi:rfaE bifunctional protein nucleotidyltransferase chain/domain